MKERQLIINNLASAIEGKSIDTQGRVEVAVKGSVLGFPATLEAIRCHMPFGVSYFIETDVLGTASSKSESSFTLAIAPRVTRGIWQALGRLLLVDAKSKQLGDKRFDAYFLASTSDTAKAKRLVTYPGMYDKLLHLHQFNNFTELHIRVPQGLVLQQPTCLDELDIDVARESFKQLAEIAQTVYELF